MNVNYKNILRKIEEVSVIDSQLVDFVKLDKQPCPDCKYDPITGAPVDTRCLTCGGTHEIITEVKHHVRANVEYISGLETLNDRGGKFEEGTVILTVHEKELDRHGLPKEHFDKGTVDFYDINGRRYVFENVTPQYLHGSMYELIIRVSKHKGD